MPNLIKKSWTVSTRDGLLLYPHSTSKYLESNQHGIKRDERNFRKYVQGVCYYGNSVLCTT